MSSDSAMDPLNGHRMTPSAEELQSQVKVAWKALASSMVARRAYRRYHGTFRYQYRFENWLTVILLLLLWGIYSIKIGDVSDSFMEIYTATTAGSEQLLGSLQPVRNDAGVVVTFVWAYTDATDRWGALAAAIAYIFVAYAIIRYQRSLQLRLSAWLTVAASGVMLIFAIDAAIRSENGRKNLVTRSTLIWVWVTLQAVLLMAGLFRKKMLPWLNQSGAFLSLALDAHVLYLGAYEGLSSIWGRFPRLREHLLQDYQVNGKPLFSFTGTYYNGMEGWLRWLGIRRLYSAQYVGGLNASGAPHGIGVWMDSYRHGEFLVGHFLNGMPVAPFRAKTNKGSGFIAYRLGVLTCRADSPGSNGSFLAVVRRTGDRVRGAPGWRPLHAGVASVECCTSGLFYKGFPRVLWLQRPTPVEDDRSEAAPVNGQAVAESAEHTSDDSVVVPLAATDRGGSDEDSPLIPREPSSAQAPAQPPAPLAAPRRDSPALTLPLPLHGAQHSGGSASAANSTRLPTAASAAPAPRGSPSGSPGSRDRDRPQQAADGACAVRAASGLRGGDAVPGPLTVADSATLPMSGLGTVPLMPHSVSDSSCGLGVAVPRDASEDASRGTQSLSVADMNEAPAAAPAAAAADGSAADAAQSEAHTMDREFQTANDKSVMMHAVPSPTDSILDQVALAAQRIPSMASKPSLTGLTELEDRIRSSTAGAGWATGQSSWLTDSSAAGPAVDAVHASGSTAVPSGSEEEQTRHTVSAPGSVLGSGSSETPGCWPCRRPRLRRPRRLWEPLPDQELAGVTRLSPWLFSTAKSAVMPDIGAFAVPPQDGGYEAILFVHGFNCSVEGALRLLGQLVALGAFPGHIMPVVFGWPCTVSIFYPQARRTSCVALCAAYDVSSKADARLLACLGCQQCTNST
eukprot:jgi/Ulvmu1/3817/UM018_0028.1